MVKTTKPQRISLGRLYHRECDDKTKAGKVTRSYLAFRRTVKPMIMGDGAIVVAWAGMFIAIETDGYTHS